VFERHIEHGNTRKWHIAHTVSMPGLRVFCLDIQQSVVAD